MDPPWAQRPRLHRTRGAQQGESALCGRSANGSLQSGSGYCLPGSSVRRQMYGEDARSALVVQPLPCGGPEESLDRLDLVTPCREVVASQRHLLRRWSCCNSPELLQVGGVVATRPTSAAATAQTGVLSVAWGRCCVEWPRPSAWLDTAPPSPTVRRHPRGDHESKNTRDDSLLPDSTGWLAVLFRKER